MIVRITLWPDQDLDVDEREVAELRALGLLIEAPAEPEPVPVATPPASPPSRSRAASGRRRAEATPPE